MPGEPDVPLADLVPGRRRRTRRARRWSNSGRKADSPDDSAFRAPDSAHGAAVAKSSGLIDPDDDGRGRGRGGGDGSDIGTEAGRGPVARACWVGRSITANTRSHQRGTPHPPREELGAFRAEESPRCPTRPVVMHAMEPRGPSPSALVAQPPPEPTLPADFFDNWVSNVQPSRPITVTLSSRDKTITDGEGSVDDRWRQHQRRQRIESRVPYRLGTLVPLSNVVATVTVTSGNMTFGSPGQAIPRRRCHAGGLKAGQRSRPWDARQVLRRPSGGRSRRCPQLLLPGSAWQGLPWTRQRRTMS